MSHLKTKETRSKVDRKILSLIVEISEGSAEVKKANLAAPFG